MAGDQAEHVAKDPRRRLSAEAGNIPFRHELDEREGGDRGAGGDAVQDADGLPIGKAARGRRNDRRHDRRVEGVAIEIDDHRPALGHELDHRADSRGIQGAGRHEPHPVTARVLEIADPGRTDAALADLDDAVDLRHLGGPPHRRGEPELFARHLVAPVDMGIDLQQRQRPMPGESLKQRDRHRVVAADHHRHRAALEDGAHRVANEVAVLRRLRLVISEVAEIGGRDGAGREDRTAEVEIDMRHIGGIGGAGRPDRLWRRGAIGADRRVGRCRRRPEDGDRPVEPGGRCRRQPEESIGGPGAEHCGDIALHECVICYE